MQVFVKGFPTWLADAETVKDIWIDLHKDVGNVSETHKRVVGNASRYNFEMATIVYTQN